MTEQLIFYMSVASGTQKRVVEALNYPYVLVNYMTKSNTPPKCARVLFVDSGGFPSSYIHNGYNKTDRQYLIYVIRNKATYYALRDYPCEPQILRRHNITVYDQIDRTLTHHIKLLELHDRLAVSATPVPVIQGWRMEHYHECIDLFREHGLISNYMAIGSLCRRHQVKKIRRIILGVRRELPSWVKLHAFGTKISVLRNKDVVQALHSVDSAAMDFAARFKKLRLISGIRRDDSLSMFDIALEEARAYLRRVQKLTHVEQDSTIQTSLAHHAG